MIDTTFEVFLKGIIRSGDPEARPIAIRSGVEHEWVLDIQDGRSRGESTGDDHDAVAHFLRVWNGFKGKFGAENVCEAAARPPGGSYVGIYVNRDMLTAYRAEIA